MNPIRILIVDDHPVVRAGLEGMLASQPDLAVVAEAANGAEALELVERQQPHLVLMDLQMPVMNGVTATAQIRARFPQTYVLVLTTYDSDANILRAVEAGATGYLLKDAPREELFRAIRAAARGESLLAPTVAARLMGLMRAPAEASLSAREVEVLALVARGSSNKEIGRALHISEATVKSHLLHIFGKLGVDDRTAAVAEGLRRGSFHPGGGAGGGRVGAYGLPLLPHQARLDRRPRRPHGPEGGGGLPGAGAAPKRRRAAPGGAGDVPGPRRPGRRPPRRCC